jgi:hypothetical protein
VQICLHNEEDSRTKETGGEPVGPFRCLSQYFLESNEKTTKSVKSARVALPKHVVETCFI